MKFKFLFLIALIPLITLSCKNEENNIIPVNFEKYRKAYIPGLTPEGAKKIQINQWNEVLEKTIGKELPNIFIVDENNNEIRLKNLINKKTLLVLTDSHCGLGMIGLTNDLPKALEKLKNNNLEINVICLFIKEKLDNENIEAIENFDSKLNELKNFYPNIYIIPSKESEKLNVYASPTRMIIEKDNTVTDISIGVSTDERLYENLKKLLPTKAHM